MALKIPSMFKQGGFGKVIPEFATGCSWVMLNDAALMTIKLDGIAILVEWNQTTNVWNLTQQHSNGDTDLSLSRFYSEDKHIWKAFDDQMVKSTGSFTLYGVGINGNPHELKGTHFVRISPVHHSLIVPRSSTVVARGAQVHIQQFYDSIEQELKQSPEIEGFVFHLEDHTLKTVQMAKVTRQDFCLPWPVVEQKALPEAKPALISY